MCCVSVCRSVLGYQGLVSDQGIPDACHGLPDGHVGVKLVAVETGHQLGQERSQLLAGLRRYDVEAKRCPLQGGGGGAGPKVPHFFQFEKA